MRALSSVFFGILALAACGGVSTPDIDGGRDAATDGAGGGDGAGGDAASDGSADGGSCTPPMTMCPTQGCPQGTVCLEKEQGPGTVDLGCTPIPASCPNGVATCDCMKSCFCTGAGSMCMAGSGVNALICFSGAISRRAFKADVSYVSDEERRALAAEALSIPLATYRYKSEAPDAKRHLGFIIDDQPRSSPAVQADRTHVDEYGYTSMLLATVQEQQQKLDRLEKKLDALEKRCK